MTRQLTIVLPSYNEEVALSRLFPQFDSIRKEIKESLSILVVDDGSSDRTSRVAAEWEGSTPVRAIVFPENRGYGMALEEGVIAAARNSSESDLIATMDADDTHDPRYLISMVDHLDQAELDVVIASRYAPGGKEEGVSWDRKLLSHGASWFYKRVFDLPNVSDYSCGYRLFRASLIQKSLETRKDLGLDSGFQASGELLLRLREQTVAIGEAPFELHYERKPTASKMQKMKTVFGTLAFLNEVRKTVRRLS
ncbi:MAG: glycosyltransferase family 2 protein [Candidatus Omnitrophica bacterium]|nr:glycosyltransferase family 2 protein [Candidatus Omnitrophota bacterium]